jgi:hypothetical protein
MACNNCSSHEWTVLEIRSQGNLAKVLENTNFSKVQVKMPTLLITTTNYN